ncbi:MAG: hypothetical protein MUF81_10990 [Verrucomicrobia bacterium]|nr:hypothetical protein [Verrucomicrobiota bacterium]
MNTAEEFEKVSELVEAWYAGISEGAMYDASTEEPDIAWQAILEILKRELTDDQRAFLAAGLMEDLLVWHGAAFIIRVEEEAKVNPRFNHLLGGVWRREMPKEIWERIEHARKEVW